MIALGVPEPGGSIEVPEGQVVVEAQVHDDN